VVHEAVAAILAGPHDAVIRLTVAQPFDDACRDGEDRHAGGHLGGAADGEIDALMAVVGRGAALIVAHARPGIEVDILLDEASDADGAVDRRADSATR